MRMADTPLGEIIDLVVGVLEAIEELRNSSSSGGNPPPEVSAAKKMERRWPTDGERNVERHTPEFTGHNRGIGDDRT